MTTCDGASRSPRSGTTATPTSRTCTCRSRTPRQVPTPSTTYPIVFRNVAHHQGRRLAVGRQPRAPHRRPRRRVGPARAVAGDLYQVDGETAHLQCQGSGSPTLVLLGGMGATTTTWAGLRAALGPDVRTCAWDYPGVGHSTGAPMMTAARAASSLARHAARRPRAPAGHPGRPQRRRPHHPPLRRRAPGRCRRRRALRPHRRLVRPHVRRPGVPPALGRDDECRPGGAGHRMAGHPLRDPPPRPRRLRRQQGVERRRGGPMGDRRGRVRRPGSPRHRPGGPGSGHDVYLDAQPAAVAAIRRVITAVG